MDTPRSSDSEELSTRREALGKFFETYAVAQGGIAFAGAASMTAYDGMRSLLGMNDQKVQKPVPSPQSFDPNRKVLIKQTPEKED